MDGPAAASLYKFCDFRFGICNLRFARVDLA